jgi:hypothetical protein
LDGYWKEDRRSNRLKDLPPPPSSYPNNKPNPNKKSNPNKKPNQVITDHATSAAAVAAATTD